MKRWLPWFLLLTAINGIIFLFRDSFQYTKFSTYEELYGACDKECRDKWDDFLLPYSNASLDEARQLLQPLRLDTGTTLTKVQAIAHHLTAKFSQQAGYPQEAVHRADPVDQYKILSADTAQKTWCGTNAQMLAFFCWSQGIVCRNLEIYRPGDHHILNECYLPELKKWMLVDVTNDIAAARQNGSLLNAQDFLKALNSPASVAVQNAGNLAETPFAALPNRDAILGYYKSAYPFYYYRVTHSKIIYGSAAKWKRYFLPVSWYEIFSPEKKGNILFYTKLFFLGLWLILAGTIVFKRITK